VETKILLFYKFTPLADPEAIRLWQRTLCVGLGLSGRIIISKDGINGTVGGSLEAIKKYRRVTREFLAFKDIDWKWSEGKGEDFTGLQVRVRDEIVTFGVPGELHVDEQGVVGGGVHLSPKEVNQLVLDRGDEVVFFDGRSAYEAKIGRFKNAVVPDVNTTKDFITELDSGKYDHLKKKPVISYCTGGIRCEVLSALMINRGFEEVYQIEGGIVRYTDQYRDKSLWEGSLYVFDERLKIDFSDNPVILGTCECCETPTNQFHNCDNPGCRRRILLCDSHTTSDALLHCAERHTSR